MSLGDTTSCGSPGSLPPAAASQLALCLSFLICETAQGEGTNTRWSLLQEVTKGKGRREPRHAVVWVWEDGALSCLSRHSALLPELTNQTRHSIMTNFPGQMGSGGLRPEEAQSLPGHSAVMEQPGNSGRLESGALGASCSQKPTRASLPRPCIMVATDVDAPDSPPVVTRPVPASGILGPVRAAARPAPCPQPCQPGPAPSPA